VKTPVNVEDSGKDEDETELVPSTLMGVARLLNKDKNGFVTGPQVRLSRSPIKLPEIKKKD
jgi:hypothetical protein